jgi:hypothetical protein
MEFGFQLKFLNVSMGRKDSRVRRLAYSCVFHSFIYVLMMLGVQLG